MCALMRQKSPPSQTVRTTVLSPPGRLLQSPASGFFKTTVEHFCSMPSKLLCLDKYISLPLMKVVKEAFLCENLRRKTIQTI